MGTQPRTHLRATVAWRIEGGRDRPALVDARLVPLMQAIDAHGSLAAASRAVDMPYRSAWALLEEAERALGTPIAALARGRGAALTPLARRLLDSNDTAAALLARGTRDIEVASTRKPAAAAAAQPLLRIAASHDIALAQLKDRWRVAHGIALAFHGSAESIDAYRSGRADLAGFHVAGPVRGRPEPLLATLDPARDAVLRFMTRAQGLIVPRGNPRRVRGVADLAAKRLRIVNRQPGSGTRLLFDRLLDRAGVDGASIAGYATEEFTHAAVAAIVSAGGADAAFGIRAAAAQFGLAFVPIVTERYLFVCAQAAFEETPVATFRALLASRATRAVVEPLPGYALDRPGTSYPLPAAR